MLVDSSNNYCSKLDIYVGETKNDNALTKFGKTHDLVMEMMKGYLGKSYSLYMDNWYSSPYLYYNLCLVQTAATDTCRTRKGLPKTLVASKFKKKGERMIMTYKDEIMVMKILDQKHVTLMLT